MPAKDPAALFYIANFLVATAEMKGDCTGWYTRLILHQFDKKSLPNNLEELANLANVRASEFEVFKQVWQQVLKQKFEVLSTGRLQDAEAAEIIRTRESFIDKRAASGRKSAFIKLIRRELCQDENVIHFIKTHVKDEQIETKDQQVLKQVYHQMFQLYINIDIDKDRIEDEVGGTGEGEAGTGSSPPEGPPWSKYACGLPQAMIEIFVKQFPGYPQQADKDFSACLQIAYQIADANGWAWQSALNDRMEDVVGKWSEIVSWITSSSWFRTKSISFLNDKFQDLIQAKNNGKADQKPFKTTQPAAGNGHNPTLIASTGFGNL